MRKKIEQIIRKVALVVLFAVLLIIVVMETGRYYHRLTRRLGQNLAMITNHKDFKNEYEVPGNIVFIANSSFQWIFPPTDFNYYFFVKQNKINRLTDTVFNASLIAPKNIELANLDNRQLFDTHVYWENEDVRRFLYFKYKVAAFKDLKRIDPSKAINEYLKEKNAGYVLTDEENKQFFENAVIVAKFPAKFHTDQCFDYHLLNDIYLLRIK